MRNVLKGEVMFMGLYLDPPVEEKPGGEPFSTDFFSFDGEQVEPIPGFEEPYSVDWLDWKELKLKTVHCKEVFYCDEDLNCAIARDMFEDAIPVRVYAGQGVARKVRMGR